MAGKSYSNDIFKIITNLDKKNYNFFNSLTETQYKELQPYILLRWMSALSSAGDSESYINKTNKLNELVFNLSNHKDLLLNLLCFCGNGKWAKHAWVALPKGIKVNKDIDIIKKFYGYNDDEMKIKQESLTKEDINKVYEYLGLKDT